MDKKAIFISTLFLLIFIFIIMYNTYYYKLQVQEYFKESFDNYQDIVNDYKYTSLTNFKNGQDFHLENRNYHNYYNLSDVKNNLPFFTFGCIKHQADNENILNTLRSMFVVSEINFYTINMNDIYNKISEDLMIKKQLLQSSGLIQSPIYIIIYQSPYLQVDSEQYVIKKDIMDNMQPSIEVNNTTYVGHKQLFTKMYIVYSKYNINDENIIEQVNDNVFINLFNDQGQFKNLITRDKLCFMKCNNTSEYTCGCLNKNDIDEGNLEDYTSSCFDMNNQTIDYGMIYVLNKYNKLFQDDIM